MKRFVPIGLAIMRRFRLPLIREFFLMKSFWIYSGGKSIPPMREASSTTGGHHIKRLFSIIMILKGKRPRNPKSSWTKAEGLINLW